MTIVRNDGDNRYSGDLELYDGSTSNCVRLLNSVEQKCTHTLVRIHN
jgi:hypothetical protein